MTRFGIILATAIITASVTVVAVFLSLLITILLKLDDIQYSVIIAIACSVIIAPPIIFAFARLSKRLEDSLLNLEQTNRELEIALSEVTALSGLLPICASCKNIRDDHGQWHQFETYINENSQAEFSHGICPGCQNTLYPNIPPEHN